MNYYELSTLHRFICNSEPEILEKCFNPTLRENYLESHKKTQEIWERAFPEADEISEMNFHHMKQEVKVLSNLDVLIALGNDLSFLLKMGDPDSHAAFTDMEKYLDEITTLLSYELAHNQSEFERLLNQLAVQPNLFLRVVSMMIESDPDIIKNNVQFLTTKDMQFNVNLAHLLAKSSPLTLESYIKAVQTYWPESLEEFLSQVLQDKDAAEVILTDIEKFSVNKELKNKLALEFSKIEECAELLPFLIDNFEITDVHLKQEIAHRIAAYEKGALSLIANLDKFGFENVEFKQELALRIAEHELGAELIAKFVKTRDVPTRKRMVIKDGSSYIEDRSLYANQKTIQVGSRFYHSSVLFNNVKAFGIQNSDFLKVLALNIAKHEKGAKALTKNIPEFENDDIEYNQQLAIEIADHPTVFSPLVSDDNFVSRAFQGRTFYRCLLIEACHHEKLSDSIYYVLKNTRSQDKNFHREIICELAKYSLIDLLTKLFNETDLAKYLEDYHIFDDCGLDELEQKKAFAEELVKYPLSETLVAAFYDIFHIDDTEFNQQLLLKMINNEDAATALVESENFFKVFHIEDVPLQQSVLKEIVKFEKTAFNTAQIFDQFGFESVEFRESIAKEIAKHDWGAMGLAKNIDKFDITSPDTRKELALQIAKHNYGAGELASSIHLFDFKDRDFLQKLAFLIAKHPEGAENLALEISKFQIQNVETKQRLAFEIAKHEEGAESLLKSIDDFSFNNREFQKKLVIEIVKHPKGARALAREIEEFEFEDGKFLKHLFYAILKFSKGRSGINTALKNYYINAISFGFDNPKDPALQFALKAESAVLGILSPLFDADLNLLVAKSMISQLNESFISEDFDSNLKIIAKAFTFDKEKYDGKDFNKACKACKNILRLQKELPNRRQMQRTLEHLAKMNNTILHIRKFEIDAYKYEADFHWLFYTVLNISFRIPTSFTDLIFESNILKSLHDIYDPELRQDMTYWFFEQVSNLSNRKELQAYLHSLGPKMARLPNIILNEIENIPPNFQESMKAPPKRGRRDDIQYKNQFLKHEMRRDLFIHALIKIKDSESISPDIKAHFFEYFTSLNDEELENELQAFVGVLALQKESELMISPKDTNHHQIFDLLFYGFEELMPGLDIASPEIFEKTFFGSRHPEALPVYVANLQSIHEKEKEPVLNLVKAFIEEVSRGTFHEKRYLESEHLRTIFAERKDIETLWKTDRGGLLADFLPTEELDSEFSFNEFLKNKIRDRHIEASDFPLLCQTLEIPVKIEIRRERASELDTRLALLVANPETFNVASLKEIQKLVDPSSEFMNDISDLIKDLQTSPGKGRETWKLVINDDPLDLFLSGTEVGGSCQRVSGQGRLNKALMGYVMDGKHKILAIKDDENKIKTRLILRLLWDDQNKKPVLFFERIYPDTTRPEYQEAMIRYALQYAADLGVDLVSREIKTDIRYKGTAAALSSRAPFEYCDAIGGIQTGPYTIPGLSKLSA